MEQPGGRGARRGAGMVLRGYVPLVGLTVVLALVVALVPSKSARSGSEPVPGTLIGKGPATSGDCEGGARQTKEPYSPPCIKWKGGDNGGATSLGVTEKAVKVVFREGNLPSLFAVAGKIGKGLGITDDDEDVRRTTRAYFDYFNKKFETYGRKVEVEFYKGKGDQLQEFFGGSPEAATADAIRVSQEIKAFADLSVLTVPYAEALAKQKVLAIPPIHMSRSWYKDHAPYTWGVFVDCSRLVDAIMDYGLKRLFDKPAKYAGDPAMRTETRKLAVVTPEQPWYKECVDEGVAKLEKLGKKLDLRINYKLDFGQLATDAPGIVAKLKAAGITTIACGCDPILPLFMAGQADQQNYHPEWFVAATALTDVDVLGQIYPADQWKHAFGLSFLGVINQGAKSESYRAYKEVRDDEPAFVHDVLYFPILLFFLGIQTAGPNLTPETFQQGLFNLEPLVGETGTWSFGPDDYTATDDAREIYWDPKGESPFNGKPGRYAEGLGGKRFSGADWPSGQPDLPIKP